LDDKINYAFSLAFTTTPDGIPQSHVIPNYYKDEINEVQWYTPVNVPQNEQSNTRFCVSESTKSPKPRLHECPEIEFKLGMNIIFKDGTGKSEHVVYNRATASGLNHIIRRIDGFQSHIDWSLLSLTNQIGFEKIIHKHHLIIAKR
jgi:hypothetical protein